MVMFYHAETCRCGNGSPEDGPLHSDAPCDCAGRTCGCYGEGYAAGKDKAHFEVRALAEGREHGPGGECAPCQTSRALIAALVREAAHAGLTGGCGLTGGKFCGANDAGDRCPGWPAGQERGNFADRCPLVATGCQLADLVDYVVSAVPPTGFRAVLEADALARETSRALAAQTLAGRADNLEREASKS